MTDIFLSYAREDLKRAALVADRLRNEGWSVWWDQDVPPASRWERVLNPELESVRSIVVLWSKYSIRSEWVIKEASVGLERAVLVPVLLDRVPIPSALNSIQAVSMFDRSAAAGIRGLQDLVQAVRSQMLPVCEIDFESTLEPKEQSLRALFNICMQTAGRFDDNEAHRLQRGVASLQVTIKWPSQLAEVFEHSPDASRLREWAFVRIPRRLPLLWLAMLPYSGPDPNDDNLRAHRNYLRFAALELFFHLVTPDRKGRRSMKAPAPLTSADVSPLISWRHLVSRFEREREETVRAYVTHIDQVALAHEFVVYGARYWTLKAYKHSLSALGVTDSNWLTGYLIPQFELDLTENDPTRHTVYKGDTRIRKVTDLDGHDLWPSKRDVD